MMKGSLLKFVNIFTGWQTRYFVLDKRNGFLAYYLNEEEFKNGHIRGKLDLKDADILIDPTDNNIIILKLGQVEWKLKETNRDTFDFWFSNIKSVVMVTRDRFLANENIERRDIRLTKSHSVIIPPRNRSSFAARPLSSISNNKNSFKLKKIDAMKKIQEIKSQIQDLNLMIHNIYNQINKFPGDKVQDLKNCLLKLSIFQKCLMDSFELEQFKLIEMIRSRQKFQDIAFYSFPTYKPTYLIPKKSSIFPDFKTFTKYLKRNNLLKNPNQNFINYPFKTHSSKSIVELIALSFSNSIPLIQLLYMPSDTFLQIHYLVQFYLSFLKLFIQENNFTGIPLYTKNSEFTRYQFRKGFQNILQPLFNIICHHTIQNSKDVYIVYLEDSLSILTISFKITVDFVLRDRDLFLNITGTGFIKHRLQKTQYEFTLPDLVIRNVMYKPSIQLFGNSLIECAEEKISINLHFIFHPSIKNYVYGFIRYDNHNFKFEGSLDKISIFNNENRMIFMDVEPFLIFRPVHASCHPCESRRLWKKVKNAISIGDADGFVKNHDKIDENSKNYSISHLDIFRITKFSVELSQKNLF